MGAGDSNDLGINLVSPNQAGIAMHIYRTNIAKPFCSLGGKGAFTIQFSCMHTH